MRATAVLALVVALTPVAPTPAPKTDFTGRWQLVKTGMTQGAADTLLVLQPPSPDEFLLERGFSDGSKIESYSVASRRGFYPAKWWGPSIVLTHVLLGKNPDSVPKHEEIWTLLPGNVLNIDAAESAPPAAAVTRHFTYTRVPLPDKIVSGQNLLE